MELSAISTHSDASCSIAATWTVAGGSLLSSVTFESSLCTIDDDTDNNHDRSSAVDSTAKSPLVLCPSSPDATPCEIIITFAQKHEVRQVYIRSTARVCEIYYAPEMHSGNEYLCTVRCGIAARGEEVLCAPETDETILTHLRGFTEEPSEGKQQSGCKLTTNEDDWVEVKVPITSLAVNSNSSLTSNSVGNSGKVLQVLNSLSYSLSACMCACVCAHVCV
uniref:Uncharacterized protein MANES_10G141000 n=1 Tax=Rhizophora mucronata TaxID=61149 RepID=A0A2P2JL64_RHIMU